MAETEEVVKVNIECPDCSNDYMLLEGEKMDIVNRKVRTVVRCPQCRRWMFHDS